jgi:alpha-methylacyl-CoA racemase
MGPLAGVKVVEIAGIGPGPFCSMFLADMGADVIRVDRLEASGLGIAAKTKYNLLNRNRPSIALNLKSPEGVETVLKLVEKADILLEGFRPGVAERLGIGPEECKARNPKLVFGRMTGWGQDGPIAHSAGHDINYISLSGALHAIGDEGGAPVPPLNLVGDFGGGAMFLASGVLAAYIEAQKSGEGQVVDVSMVEGSAYLATSMFGMMQSGNWKEERGVNILDGGAHFYGTYETKDGKHVSIGSIEPKFYDDLLKATGLDGEELPAQMDKAGWAGLKDRLASVFKTKTRDEWDEIMLGSDICYAPILSFSEAAAFPHNVARESFSTIDGVFQPSPAPKFSRTKTSIRMGVPEQGSNTTEALSAWGFGGDEIAGLKKQGAIGGN